MTIELSEGNSRYAFIAIRKDNFINHLTRTQIAYHYLVLTSDRNHVLTAGSSNRK